MIKVSTIKSGKEYRVKTDACSYLLSLADNGMVFIYTKTTNLGGYRLERFGDSLSPANIRNFFDTNEAK